MSLLDVIEVEMLRTVGWGLATLAGCYLLNKLSGSVSPAGAKILDWLKKHEDWKLESGASLDRIKHATKPVSIVWGVDYKDCKSKPKAWVNVNVNSIGIEGSLTKRDLNRIRKVAVAINKKLRTKKEELVAKQVLDKLNAL